MKVVMKVVNVVMKVVNDLSCLRGFEDEETDRQTEGQTLVNVQSLPRL